MHKQFKETVIKKLGVSPDAFRKAEDLAKAEGILIIHALIRLGIADPKNLLAAYSHIFKVRVANLDSMDIPDPIIRLIPADIAKKSRIIPLDRVGNNIIIAIENPHDLKMIDLIRFQTGFSAKTVLAPEDQLSRALDRYYRGTNLDLDKLSKDNASGVKTKIKTERRAVIGETHSEDSGPIIQLVDQILVQCLSRGASDIHIEPYENHLRVRLRIDGALHEIARPPASYKAPVTSRFKIMAGLNIAEKRLPQDGNINVTINNKPIDFRVNTLPTIYGEKIVLRILDKSSLQVDLTKLGFEPNDLIRFKECIYRPFGMVLVTGPTGSGKTTTLYSALSDLNQISENIMTAEDPVEYNLDGINQVNINASIGLTFASALRAFLRQDPDIIMVGEIRDFETGEIAIKAALTGHLVLSTLHTNNAADTIVRMQNMGLESFNLISSLNVIVAQRLMRKLCEHCKEVDPSIKAEYLVQLGIDPRDVKKFKPLKAVGCNRCSQTGYKGRLAVHEVMVITDELRQAIMRSAPAMELKKIAMREGMHTLRQNGLIKMARGEVDALEVVKVTSSDTDSISENEVA
ncbi:MAG: type IV-A pilus assembly ATPase PilB [Oligoflexus sp.]